MGLFVLSPFQRWRHDHAIHHATSGDLERRGVGDIITLTVTEYWARPRRGRLAYRVIRNPVVMFGLGPVIAMIIGPRIATRSQRPRLRHSVFGTDVALLVVIGGFVLADWLAELPPHLGTFGDPRWLGRDLALLRAASVRRCLLAKRR